VNAEWTLVGFDARLDSWAAAEALFQADHQVSGKPAHD
jgi:hypothetical protein